MSVAEVKRFYEDVTQNESLKQKLVELSQKYQGQPRIETKVMSNLEQEVFSFARERGYSFTMDDVKAYSEEWKHFPANYELSDEELQAVVGGDGTSFFCFLFGGPQDGGGAEGFCFLGGKGSYNGQSSTCFLYGQATFR